jgi:hypothetical protein
MPIISPCDYYAAIKPGYTWYQEQGTTTIAKIAELSKNQLHPYVVTLLKRIPEQLGVQ